MTGSRPAPVIATRAPTSARLARELPVVAIIAVAGAVVALRLWRTRLGIPLRYGGDELSSLAHVKGVDETGWWVTNPRLGAPFRLEHYDFPQGAESLQIALVRLIGLVSDAPATIINVYFLATFALVAASAHVVLRVLRFSTVVAGAAAILYAFLPFHFWHGTPHIYRSGYFAAPIAALVLLWLTGYDGGLTEASDDGRRRFRRRRIIVVAVAVLLLATTDTVAAAFAPAIALVVALLGALRRRPWLEVAGGVAFALATVLAVVAANTPTLLHQLDEGSNSSTVRRELQEQEIYGLKLSRVLLPSESHPVEALAELGQKPLESRIQSEGGQALGIVGVLGLIGGVVAVLAVGAPDERRRVDPRDGRIHLARRCGTLMVITIVLAVPAGASYIASVAGFEEIRTWNRIVVYLGFFALVVSAIGLEHIRARLTAIGHGGAVFVSVVVLVTAIGVYDQSPGSTADYDGIARDWNRDAQFFEQVERSLRDDADPMAFQLPLVPYPEPPRGSLLIDYDHFRGYLHTDEVAWSYAAMKGRPEARWQRQLGRLPASVALDALAAIGFDGVYVDTWAYADGGSAVDAAIGTEPDLADVRQRWYRLDGRDDELSTILTPAERRALVDEVLHPTVIHLEEGFHAPGVMTRTGSFMEDRGRIRLERLGGDATVTLRLDLLTAPGAGHRVTLQTADGGELVSATSDDERRVRLEHTLDVPADGLDLWLSTESPAFQAEGDPRRIHVALADAMAVGPVTAQLVDRLDPSERERPRLVA